MINEKITSKEQYLKLYYEMPCNVTSDAKDKVNRHKRSPESWWDMREAIRMETIYETTSVLEQLNQRMPYYAHISQQDKKLVAYTPDRESGEQDRQVRVSIGRLLQKMYPALSQNDMRSLIEQHDSEANVEVEFLTGEVIRDVYIMENGVGSCMAGEREWTKETHPALAYDAPNIKLAVLRKLNGSISARCLVYTPTETDKYMVRAYGAPALAKYLARNGYKLGGLSGATLRKVPHPTKQDVYRLPYLDFAGGMTNTQFCSVVLADGEIRVLTSDQRSQFLRAGMHVSTCGSSGDTTLVNVDTAEFKTVDAITGETFSLLTEDHTKVWVNGAEGKAKRSAIPADFVRVNGLYVAAADTIIVNGNLYINDVSRLVEEGLRRLDPTLYPDKEGQWFSQRQVHGADPATGFGYLKSDCVAYVTEDNEKSYLHVSKVDKPIHVKLVGKCESMTIFAHKNADIKRTVKGSKVHVKVHELITLFNGGLDYARGKKRVSLLNDVFWYDSKTHTEAEVLEAVASAALDAEAQRIAYHDGSSYRSSFITAAYSAIRRVNSRYIDGYSVESMPVELRDVSWMRGNYTYNTNLERLRQLTSRQLLAYYKVILEENHGSLGRVTAQAILYHVRNWIAEEEAVEAPHYLSMPDTVLPEPTITILPTVAVDMVEPAEVSNDFVQVAAAKAYDESMAPPFIVEGPSISMMEERGEDFVSLHLTSMPESVSAN